jgi:putative flavoprotein involved in K+ transport
MSVTTNHKYETIVVGGGQAGLAVSYHLAKRGMPHLVLDAHPRIGDAWRGRWDSLRLFTPAHLNTLPGMSFPAPPRSYPTKDQMADYLEAYAARFELPVETGVRVQRLSQNGRGFALDAGGRRYEAENVIVAMASYQQPKIPLFAAQLDAGIRQLHSSQYKNPGQLQDGPALVVGVGNSGAEIAFDLAKTRTAYLSGKEAGSIPFSMDSFFARYIFFGFLLPFLGKYVLTIDTPIGRKARPRIVHRAAPLFPVKPADLAEAGVERLPRTVGVQNGRPVVEGGRALDVKNVVWCTGYHPGFSWIDLPLFGDEETLQEPLADMHERGVVKDYPGLYFVGLHFLYAASSGVVGGAGRDAEFAVEHLAANR